MSTAIQMIDDQRLSLPSASKLPGLFACAGMREMEAIAESQRVRVDDSNRDSERGVMLHKASEIGDVSDLDDNDAETVTQIRAIEESLVNAWLDENGLTISDVTIYRELRIWVGSVYSTQLDTLVVSSKGSFVLDTKTGRKKVSSPATNWQLRAQAIAVARKFDSTPVRTAIVQPMMTAQPVCDYSAAQLSVAYERIYERLEYIKQSGLPRTPGSQCEFCKGRHLCPEAKKSMSVVIGARLLNWSLVLPEEKLKLWKAASMAEDCAKLIKDQIKADISASPDAVPGLVKAKDQKPVSISNPAQVAIKLGERFEGGSTDLFIDFLAVSKLSKANAISIIRERTGFSKADAERFLLVDCADAVKEGFRQGSVSIEE